MMNMNPNSGEEKRHSRRLNDTRFEEDRYLSPDMGTLEIPTQSSELELNAMSPMTSSATSRGNSSMVSRDDAGSFQSRSTIESHRKKSRRDPYLYTKSSSRSMGEDSLVISVPSTNGRDNGSCTDSNVSLRQEEYIQKLVEAGNGARDDLESITEYDERANTHLRRNLKLVVRQKVFCEKKFLTDKSLLMMKYGTEDELPMNVLGIVLVNLNKDRMTVLDRVVFWKRWGMEVKRTLNDLKSSVCRIIKDVVLKGKIFFLGLRY